MKPNLVLPCKPPRKNHLWWTEGKPWDTTCHVCGIKWDDFKQAQRDRAKEVRAAK